jgi:hypothetical protein
VSGVVNSANIAWMSNQAGGRIVLTDEVCKDKGKTYSSLNRLFMYTSEGYTMEGCFYISGDLVNAIWTNGREMKYEVNEFTLYNKSKGISL